MPEQMRFSLLGWARGTVRGVPVPSLSAGLCLLLSRISSASVCESCRVGLGQRPHPVCKPALELAAVLLAASDKSCEFSSVPAFLMSLLLSPTSETLSVCAMCSTKSIVSPLQRDAKFLLFSLLLLCNLSVLCCPGSCGHQKVFCNRNL